MNAAAKCLRAIQLISLTSVLFLNIPKVINRNLAIPLFTETYAARNISSKGRKLIIVPFSFREEGNPNYLPL